MIQRLTPRLACALLGGLGLLAWGGAWRVATACGAGAPNPSAWPFALGTLGVGLLAGACALWAKLHTEHVFAEQQEHAATLYSKSALNNQAVREKSEILANLSHELRTPLNAILGLSEVIRQRMGPVAADPQIAGFVTDIHQAGEHLLALINEVLDLSKLEAGHAPLIFEEVNASKLVLQIIRLLTPRAEDAGIVLCQRFPNTPLVLEADSKRLRQVLLNLVSNAIKFTPRGGTVTLGGWHDLATDMLVFQVSDTGVGMEAKDIARAMAEFEQVGDATYHQEGTGLGLPITRQLVLKMGGKFHIESRSNTGTQVTFFLPRHAPAQASVPGSAV